VLSVAVIGATFNLAAADSLSDAMRLVPPDTVGAIVIPDLKRGNDELALCLERMDRPEAFFVGRPIDLAKAHFGLSVGVRDHGALLAVLRWPADRAEPMPLLIVPVNDAAAFLDGNFVRNQAGTLSSARLDGMHALDLGRWVALSPEAAALEGVRVADDSAAMERLHERLGERATELLRGEGIAWIDGAALRRLEGRADLGSLGDLPGVPAALGELPMTLPLEGLDLAAMSIDLDALGVMLHGALRYDEQSPIGAALRRPGRPAGSMSRLPDNTPYWALSIDVEAMRPLISMALPEGTINARTLALMEGIVAVQWGCWPSRLGVAVGGILNDSSLLVQTSDPAALHRGITDFIEQSAGEHDGVLIEPQLERNRPLRDGGSADAFEVRETPLPDGDATMLSIRSGVRSALFGNRGVHGFVRAVPDGVVVTFSQRPDVLGRATDAGVTAPAFAAAPVVAAMREFMVGQPVLEGYLGVSELARVARQLAGTFGMAEVVPAVDAGAEPVGVALSIDHGTLLGSTVIPAGVLGAMMDQARRMR